MIATVLRVRDWQEHFENNRTRELKSLTWLPVPNKQDGDGYTELILHKNGPAHYGCWHAILGVASKCDPRGTLLRGCKKPHDSASLERITRIPASLLDEAVKRLIEIGWLERISLAIQDVSGWSQEGATIPQEGATIPQETALEGKGREGKGKKGREGKEAPQIPAALDSPVFLDAWDRWKKHRAEIHKPLTASSVAAQLKALSEWGTTRAIAAIEHSIACGYQGIFEPKNGVGVGRRGSESSVKPALDDGRLEQYRGLGGDPVQVKEVLP